MPIRNMEGTIKTGIIVGMDAATGNREDKNMKVNEGTIDRTVRIIAGLVLISLVFIGPQTAWGWIGLLPLATGLAGRCPAYSLFGINTCSMKKSG